MAERIAAEVAASEQATAAGPVQAEAVTHALHRAAGAVREADFLLVAGGAGLSADSGLLTFAQMTAKLGCALGGSLSYDQAAGSDMMVKDPSIFYGFWFAAEQSYESAEPHEGYSILREWSQRVEERGSWRRPVFALTSNIDGFLQRSGVAKLGSVAEIHGCIKRWQCGGVPSGQKFPLFKRPRCCDELFASPSPQGADFESLRFHIPQEGPPRCPRCSEGWLRPHVYLFGDGNRFVEDEASTGKAAFSSWQQEVLDALRGDASLHLTIIELGCGIRVPSIRKRCEELLAACPRGQGDLVRINPEFEDQWIVMQPTIAVKAPALAALRQMHRDVVR
mmetsp:Transcript_48464/g.105799  ORF Transcript_48464/g.105799 Transcript_48464/m.105799 type:complete len:336 (+) Transcript_48464:50-1057(+)